MKLCLKEIWIPSNATRIILSDSLHLQMGHMWILTKEDPSIGPPAFFKQTHTHKHSVWWNGWVIGSLCLQCCVLARPVMAPFAVCSNGVNGISSLSPLLLPIWLGDESLTPVALCADGLQLNPSQGLKACLTNPCRTTSPAPLLHQVNKGFKSVSEVCLFWLWDLLNRVVPSAG